MLIAIDRSSFNYIFKYNSMTISKSQILDLSKEILESETNKNSSFIVSEFDRILPIFELDHEVLLLEVQKSKLEFDGEINLPFASILKVYPLTERAKNLLSGKLNQSIEISVPRFESTIELVKLSRAMNNRKLLFTKLSKICLLDQYPTSVFCEKVESIVELLLKNQSVGNSYLANLIQYNYSPNEISSGNIEFLEKTGIITWITTQSSSEGYTNSKYFKRCEEFKSKINEGNYVTGFKTYLDIIEHQSSDFKNSHDKIKEIINEGQIEIDLFKVSYYFLALKTKLNKNNSNLLELFEDMIRDVHSDNITMAYVLYLISFSFSFEQLYESIHILEKSVLLKSKFIVRDAQTIFHDLAIVEVKLESERIINEKEQMMRDVYNQHQEELEEKKKIAEEAKEKEMDLERSSLEIQSHESDDDKNIQPVPVISENKKDEIELGKPIELSLFDNSEIVTIDDDLKEPDLNGSTNSENETSLENEGVSSVSEPSTNYKNSDNIGLVNNSHKEEYEKTVDSNSSTTGINEEELKIIEINTSEPLDTPKKNKVSKKALQKNNNNEPVAATSISIIQPSEVNNLKNQKPDSNIEQNTTADKRIITVQIFEDEFILPNYKDNKEKFVLWDELMGKFFPIKTDSVTLRSIMNQIKLRKATKEGLMNTPEELEKITHFFDQ